VSGQATLDDEGQLWMFTAHPDADVDQLRIDRRLEDLAGNSVRRVFDRDLELAAGNDVDSDLENDVDRPALILRAAPPTEPTP
jgi:hypothetical protein